MMLIDPFGRKITYLRISLTDMCNYKCVYCMPANGVELKPHAEILRYEEIEEIVRVAVQMGIIKIRLTGGEPLVKKEIVSLVQRLAAIAGLDEITMTTNASLLTPQLAAGLKEAGLGRINISLDTLKRERFAELTRGGNIDDVLAGISAAREAGLTPIKINMIIFEDTTAEDIDVMRMFCDENGLTLQTIMKFSLYDQKDPGGAKTADRPPKCSNCNRLRLTADGFLKPCLFSSNEIKIDFADIKGSLLKAVGAKPESGRTCSNRIMSQIGG